jgi:hypothetical protein
MRDVMIKAVEDQVAKRLCVLLYGFPGNGTSAGKNALFPVYFIVLIIFGPYHKIGIKY